MRCRVVADEGNDLAGAGPRDDTEAGALGGAGPREDAEAGALDTGSVGPRDEFQAGRGGQPSDPAIVARHRAGVHRR